MTTDTRTEAERRYDAERDGTLYIEPKQQTKARLLSFLDGVPEAHRDMAMLGMELLCYAGGDVPIPGRLHTAVLADAYERAREKALAEAAAQPKSEDYGERYPDIELGTIDGCVVIGHYSDEAPHKLFCASMTWNGLKFSTDGEDYINLDTGDETTCCGDMSMHEWGTVKALAHTDVMEQLIALAKAKATR